MTFLDTHRFIFYKIGLNFQKFILNFKRWFTPNFLAISKKFRSDNAIEYRESTFLTTLKQHGTLPHRSCPGISQQNGRVERKYRHIFDTVRALLISASILERFWVEAALIAVYTIIRVPSPTTLNKSPYELLYGSPLGYQSLCVFDCTCFVLLQPINALNYNHVLTFVVLLVMTLSVRVIVVIIL